MIIDTHLHPTNLVDEAWRHTGTPFTGERMLKLMRRLELLDVRADHLIEDVQQVRALSYGFRKRVLLGPKNDP